MKKNRKNEKAIKFCRTKLYYFNIVFVWIERGKREVGKREIEKREWISFVWYKREVGKREVEEINFYLFPFSSNVRRNWEEIATFFFYTKIPFFYHHFLSVIGLLPRVKIGRVELSLNKSNLV